MSKEKLMDVIIYTMIGIAVVLWLIIITLAF